MRLSAAQVVSIPPKANHPIPMHATDYLKKPQSHDPGGIVVVFGDQDSLKRSVLDAVRQRVLGGGADDDLSIVRLAGKDAEWTSVADELRTISMFGDHRVVQIDTADDFVSDNRGAIEKYLDGPSRSSTLILDVSKWPKTTRLAKRLTEAGFGLVVECSALTGVRLQNYLKSIARERFDKAIDPDALAMMIQLVGDSLGLLEQELDKVASFAGDADSISVDDVRAVVGGWRIETTWKMLDAVRDGNADDVFKHLTDLLDSGEAVQKLLGGVSFSYRKLAKAVELSRSGQPLPVAMKDAGVYHRDVDAYTAYLRRVTRMRAELFLLALQETDAGLKGRSALDEKTQLETLLLRLL